MLAYKANKIRTKVKEVEGKIKNVSGLKVGTNGVPKLICVDRTELNVNFRTMIHHKHKVTPKEERQIFLSAKETG